ncbi:hypothetical protein DC498_21245 [Terrimonas sp.]|uniref:ABC-three component system middle component 1 n=1 Tax=Terrimonas sp. TaxID=1914338 RepID=UPI000D509325|nr:ABC-three component system middle component 1 [Terrimonas sp.]PVD50143.1 hypothetical protein DC498_21245 [Terrimonas sp.]
MINLISRIFEEAGLEEKANTDFKIYALKEQQNYWVIVQYDDLDKIISEQIELFVKAKEIIQEPTFDKNANLLVLNKVDAISNIKPESLLQIEENPYHFKKSILYYTEVELKNLSDTIGDSIALPTIESLILTDTIFEKHKMYFDANDFESLVYRMAIKIPFIKIKITQTNNLKSLEEINKKSVENNQLNDLLEQNFFSLSDEDFSAMTDEAILEKLKSVLPDENQQNQNPEL